MKIAMKKISLLKIFEPLKISRWDYIIFQCL